MSATHSRVASHGRLIGFAGIALALMITGCDSPITGPGPDQMSNLKPSAIVITPGLSVYTDRASWAAAVVAAGGTVQNMDFTGLTTGRVTQLDTDYGSFRIVTDRVSATSFSNPGIDIFPDASCSLGVGDCEVFTFNMADPTSVLDMPKINQLIFPQNIIAFGGDFIQAGYTAGGGTPTATGPVTLHIGTESIVVNSYLDGSGNGFFGVVATASNTVGFTFTKSGSLQNDILQIYNPSYANAPTGTATVTEMVEDFRTTLGAMTFPAGIGNALDAKLRATLKALDAANPAGACSALQDLINQTNALTGKKITSSQAATILGRTAGIRSALGC